MPRCVNIINKNFSCVPMDTLLNALKCLSPQGQTSVHTRTEAEKKPHSNTSNLVLYTVCGGRTTAMIITEVYITAEVRLLPQHQV